MQHGGQSTWASLMCVKAYCFLPMNCDILMAFCLMVSPDRKLMVMDIAWGGGDFTACPIAYVYGDAVFIPDLVFNNGDKTVTRPEVVGKIMPAQNQRGAAAKPTTAVTNIVTW